jgi:hypothetical protein
MTWPQILTVFFSTYGFISFWASVLWLAVWVHKQYITYKISREVDEHEIYFH